jgi:glycosyltransferase involved in cell wall biosynthesis
MGGPGEHVTVVLPTRRRPVSLERVLRGLARQEDPGVPWDLVVVDNDALPGRAEAAARAALDSLPVPVRVVVETELGASNARNRGIAEASGTIIAFIDDDVVPDDDWLARVIEPVLAGRCEAVGGRVELDPSVPRPRWFTPWLVPYLADFSPWDSEIDLCSLPRGVLSEPYLLTANAAFTADVLKRSGGFDPMLGPRDGVPFVNDDLYLCRQVIAAGGRIHYFPAAHVVHELPVARLRRSYMARRLYAQGRSDWLLEREVLATARTAGVLAGLEHLVADARAVVGPGRAAPAHRWLLASVARRSGFLREALVCLVRRRR